ncbi:MAG: 50S ribosomal protein L30 [Nitrososphaeraceae archaeon]
MIWKTAYLVVRIKGTVNVPAWAKTTLANLNLDKKFRATLVAENLETLGMLRKVKDIVAWTSVDADFIKELLERRGKLSGYKPITKSDLPKGFESIEELATAIAQNKTSMSKLNSIKPWFALAPPKGGFKQKTKTQFSQNGVLGHNEHLVQLVKNML